MTRSHPPTLLRLAERALKEECGVEKGMRILVAVSGGPDSSALLHVLSLLAPRLGFSVAAHGIDHGLRAEAAAELDMAERLAGRCGVPFTRRALRLSRGGNLQARARDARRRALEKAAEATSAVLIATAHHMNDRAETVLIRLLSGAAPAALAVLPPRDGRWIRPLIRAQREDVLAHLHRHDVPFVEDPSNRDPRFLRTRVRRELLPLMQELSPGIVPHLAALADAAGTAGLPVITADSGERVPLKRSQADLLGRALRLGRPARIRLPDDRELEVEPRTGRLALSRAAPLPRRKRTKLGKPLKRPGLPDKGDAKRGKSG